MEIRGWTTVETRRRSDDRKGPPYRTSIGYSRASRHRFESVALPVRERRATGSRASLYRFESVTLPVFPAGHATGTVGEADHDIRYPSVTVLTGGDLSTDHVGGDLSLSVWCDAPVPPGYGERDHRHLPHLEVFGLSDSGAREDRRATQTPASVVMTHRLWFGTTRTTLTAPAACCSSSRDPSRLPRSPRTDTTPARKPSDPAAGRSP